MGGKKLSMLHSGIHHIGRLYMYANGIGSTFSLNTGVRPFVLQIAT